MMALPFEVMPSKASAQEEVAAKTFKQEELDQMLAPVALYPDSLLTQILMASTYPLEIVQADRWVKQNKDMKGDALTKALEAQPWDPSVKSLVNFPQVLQMMSEKLDLTQKLGDAFLAQQKDVMATIQSLRKKAEASGNLKTSKEQKVVVEKETIIIQSASPEVIYVPSYNPIVVYGSWPYPAYPPYYYYPPVYATPYAFGAGIAIGAAWGYAWGHADWHGGYGGYGNVKINHNQNININNNINRGKYASQLPAGGQGNWQHNASHRGGVAYRDQKTAQQYNRGAGSEAAKSREAYRGRAEQGRQDIAKGGADQFKGKQGQGQYGGNRSGSKQGGGAYSGMNRGGAATRDMSSRGSSSRQSVSSGSRGGGSSYGGGGGSRGGGGGGGSRGGGGGGSRGGGGGGGGRR
jgi:hypothetical protein